MMYMAPGEEVLKAEKICSLWSPIFNYEVDKLYLRDHDARITRYIFIEKLLRDYFG